MDKHPLIGDVRGRGLMIGVELVRDRADEGARDRRARRRRRRPRSRAGCWCSAPGKNAIRFSPPLVLTREQADIGDQDLRRGADRGGDET